AALFDHDPELRLSGQPRTPSPSEQDVPPKIAAKNGAKTAAKTAAKTVAKTVAKKVDKTVAKTVDKTVAKTVAKAGGASSTNSIAKQPGKTATPAHAAPAEDSFYISATESASRPRCSLKHNDTFMVLDSFGDIGAAGAGTDGLFHCDTRFLSRLQLLVNGTQPLLL